MEFSNKWMKSSSPGFSSRVKTAVRPEGPIKPRLETAVKSLENQISKLQNASAKLTGRDENIFKQVVISIKKKDKQHAAIYANELSEVRKMNRMVTQAKLSIEQIVMRLNTVQDLGDVVVTLAPAMSVVKNVKTGLAGVLPQAEKEFGEVNDVLSGLLTDAGQVGNYTVDFQTANDDAQQIVDEATAMAETQISESLPALPLSDTLPKVMLPTSEEEDEGSQTTLYE